MRLRPGSFGEQSNQKFEYTMRYKGRLKTPEEYGNIIISSNTNGQTVHLRDVAKVELGGLMYSVMMKNNSRPAVIGMVNQVAGSNATQIADDVKTALADAQKQMPPGMKVTIEQDVTEFPLCFNRRGCLYIVYNSFIGIFRCVYLLAGHSFNVNSNDSSTSGFDRYLLLPLGIWFLYQLANPFGNCCWRLRL